MPLFPTLESLEAPDQHFKGHRDLLVRNMARYTFAKPHARGIGLDLGCGRGYGFDVIGPALEHAVGVDVSEAFLAEARANYPQVEFVHSSGEKLPFPDARFDAVMSFEVIEHAQDDHAFLSEIRRVAKPGAFIAISTPNRPYYTSDTGKPLNEFHVREYDAPEFEALLRGVFSEVDLYGQVERLDAAPTQRRWTNRLTDLVPMRLKFLLPQQIQDRLSIALRPPLRLDDCKFVRDFAHAHTLLAFCKV